MYLEVVEKKSNRGEYEIRPPYHRGRYRVLYEWHADDELIGATVLFPRQFKTFEVAFPPYRNFSQRPNLQGIAYAILKETDCVIRWAIANNKRRGGNDCY